MKMQEEIQAVKNKLDVLSSVNKYLPVVKNLLPHIISIEKEAHTFIERVKNEEAIKYYEMVARLANEGLCQEIQIDGKTYCVSSVKI